MADNIRLITFAGSTVTPQDDALVYETAVGQNGIINGGAITLKNNNTLHIAAGHGIICGRKFSIVESDITVLLTTGDTQQGRVYIHLDLSNTTDPIQILTETGSTLTEPIQQEDVNISNGIYEFNIATFTIDALAITELVDVKPIVEKNSKVDTLVSMEEVEATTDNTIPVGAGAVKQLNESLEIESTKLTLSNVTQVGDQSTPYCFKSGNLKMLNLKVQFPNTLNINTFYKIATLPEKYRPSYLILKPIITGGNGLFYVRIQTTGEVEMYSFQAGLWNVYVNETYI